jgi:hypothetical protein
MRIYKPSSIASYGQWGAVVGRELDLFIESIIRINQEVVGSLPPNPESGDSVLQETLMGFGFFLPHESGASPEVAPGMLVTLLSNGAVVPATATDPNREAHGLVLKRLTRDTVLWIRGGTHVVPTPIGANSGSTVLLLGEAPGSIKTSAVKEPNTYFQQIGLLIKPISDGQSIIDLDISPPASY